MPTKTPPSPTLVPPTETQITIDGQADDWVGRPGLLDDPIGDAEEGFLDLTTGYAFVNQDAVYLLVETVDSSASFVHFDIQFQTGFKRLQISWAPGWTRGFLGDVTAGWELIGEVDNSTFAFGPALEGRVDLRDMGSPESINLTSINVKVGECCQPPTWRDADQWQPGSTPVVNEFDPPRLVSDEPRYMLARHFELPEGYVAKRLFAPPLPDLFAIARSQSGVVYLQHRGYSAGISTLDPISGQATRILDLPDTGVSFITGGPGETAIISVGGEIWQVRPDGSYEVWGHMRDGAPHHYTSDGRLLGRAHDWTRVLELFPDGSSREVATGFTEIWDIVAAADGAVFVSDWKTGNITRVNPDGSKQVLAERVVFRDPMDLALDPAGNLYLSVAVPPVFRRLDSNTSAFTGLRPTLTECAMHPADFVFTSETRALFLDPTWSMITWADLSTGDSGVLAPNNGANTRAAAIGPDDALYVGSDGCKGSPPGQIVRVAQDGTRTVVVDSLPEQIWGLQFTPDGGMYIATGIPGPESYWLASAASYPVYYVPPGERLAEPVPGAEYSTIVALPNGNMLGWVWRSGRLIEYSPQGAMGKHIFYPPETIHSFSLTTAPDGHLYGFAELARGERLGPTVYRQLLRIDLETGQTELLYENNFAGSLAGGTISAATDGTLWLILFPDFEIYHVLPDGTATLFARNLPTDAWKVTADSQGNVYFTSPGGIYRIYREP